MTSFNCKFISTIESEFESNVTIKSSTSTEPMYHLGSLHVAAPKETHPVSQENIVDALALALSKLITPPKTTIVPSVKTVIQLENDIVALKSHLHAQENTRANLNRQLMSLAKLVRDNNNLIEKAKQDIHNTEKELGLMKQKESDEEKELLEAISRSLSDAKSTSA